LTQPSRFLVCPPHHFGIEYVINPWMEGQIHAANRSLAQRQWAQFHSLLSAHSEVFSLSPVEGLPDLVFTANAALVYRDLAVLSNFRFMERRGEAQYFSAWLSENGFRVQNLPPDIMFEGAGDALFDWAHSLLWMGHGFRSDLAAAPHLKQLTGVDVQPLHLIDGRFYHLDTCFCPLERGFLLYYPPAFDAESNHAIESRVPAEKRLALTDSDAVDFACNTVNIEGRVILNHASDETVRWLESRDFQVIQTAMTEFMRAGGSAKCLSLRLDEPHQ